MLKQTYLKPKDYPDRAEVGNPYDWFDPAYKPRIYTCPSICGMMKPPWADEVHVPFLDMLERKSISRSGDITKLSQVCTYSFVHSRFLNPRGKTGIQGRGELGKWADNWAADVIVTKEEAGELFVLLCTKTCNDGSSLCFPAGMVEAGEEVPQTMRRELCEEAVTDSTAVDQLFSDDCKVGTVYAGFVDDYRNTDHAWIVTQATHFHASPEVASALKLGVKDIHEISGSAWYKAADVTEMYASHKEWLDIVIAWHHNAAARPPRSGEKRQREEA